MAALMSRRASLPSGARGASAYLRRHTAVGARRAPLCKPLHAIAAPTHPDATTPVPGDLDIASVKIMAFSSSSYVNDFLEGPLTSVFPNTTLVEASLDPSTAALADGCPVVVAFVNDNLSAKVLERLASGGTKLIAMRCAGYDRLDLKRAQQLGITAVRVPTYSPVSVAEHAVALMFALNRHLALAQDRIHVGNYSLNGLVGFEMQNKVAVVVGTGAIGAEACRILHGIGMKVIAHSLDQNPKVVELGIPYMDLDEALGLADIVTLHCPLLPSTQHLINADRIKKMKEGSMLINVSRGGLVCTDALMDALECGHVSAAGLDVYEGEDDLFFTDFTNMSVKERIKSWDRRFKALCAFPTVLVTPHSAFLTKEALANIADTTVENIRAFVTGQPLVNEIKPR